MKISIGSDHIGNILKPIIISHLESLGHEVTDFGCYTDERVNYPDYSIKVAESIVSKKFERGILICGTGVGISIAANKIKGIRAVVCSEPYTAKLSKQHNDTNILAFGSQVVGPSLAKLIVDEWLSAEFEGGRHNIRVTQISDIENR